MNWKKINKYVFCFAISTVSLGFAQKRDYKLSCQKDELLGVIKSVLGEAFYSAINIKSTGLVKGSKDNCFVNYNFKHNYSRNVVSTALDTFVLNKKLVSDRRDYKVENIHPDSPILFEKYGKCRDFFLTLGQKINSVASECDEAIDGFYDPFLRFKFSDFASADISSCKKMLHDKAVYSINVSDTPYRYLYCFNADSIMYTEICNAISTINNNSRSPQSLHIEKCKGKASH